MAKDTAACPYCGFKADIKAGAIRPHLVGGKDGADVCDGGGMDVNRLAAPAGEDSTSKGGSK